MKKKNGTNEETAVVAVEATLPAVAVEAPAWGASVDIELEDILIPRIPLMQKMSELVDQGIAQPGQFVDSIENTILGDEEKPVEIVIFDFNKTWTELVKGEAEFIQSYPFDATNKDQPREYEADGRTIVRNVTFNFYCLLANSAGTLPYVISMSRSAAKCAKQILSYIMRLKWLGKASAGKVFELTSVKATKDKYTFYVPQVKVGRDSTDEELAIAKRWYETLHDSKVRVRVHDDAQVVAASMTADGDDIPF